MKHLKLLLIYLAMPAIIHAQGVLTTIVGMGAGTSVDNVPATQSAIGPMPGKAIMGPGNHIYIADGIYCEW